MAYDPLGDQSARYREIIKAHTCTPEQQAGPDAAECPHCRRPTLHQYTKEPMCGCSPSLRLVSVGDALVHAKFGGSSSSVEAST
jgi:hypothetical protein